LFRFSQPSIMERERNRTFYSLKGGKREEEENISFVKKGKKQGSIFIVATACSGKGRESQYRSIGGTKATFYSMKKEKRRRLSRPTIGSLEG